MPNIDELVDGISQIIADRKKGGVPFYNIGFHLCVQTSIILTSLEK